MGILAVAADERVANVSFDQDTFSVRLKDGHTISGPPGMVSKTVPCYRRAAPQL
jgi:hypothetical protein